MWAAGCVHTNRETGEKTSGRDAIKKDLAEAFSAPAKMRLSGQIQSIRVIRPEVALVDGETTVSSSDTDPITTQFSAVLVKNEGKWQIDSMEEMPLAVAPGATEALEELSWLEGTWVDNAPGSQVFSSVRWSTNKTFLIRSMTEEGDGVVSNLGTQIIGWDPRARQIRSWVFNTDGSFGEGVWTKAAETWMVKSTQTTPQLPSVKPAIPKPGGGMKPSVPSTRPSIPSTRPSLPTPSKPNPGNPAVRPLPGNVGDFLGLDRPVTLPGVIGGKPIPKPSIPRPEIPSTKPALPQKPNIPGFPSTKPAPIPPTTKPNRPYPSKRGWNNDVIHQRPGWVNIDNSQITIINNNWQSQINNISNWHIQHPQRICFGLEPTCLLRLWHRRKHNLSKQLCLFEWSTTWDDARVR